MLFKIDFSVKLKHLESRIKTFDLEKWTSKSPDYYKGLDLKYKAKYCHK
jgi:hypothetical protein